MKVVELWRYPVKSMQGEQLEQADIGFQGIDGDRRRAVVDAKSGVSLSAKRYADLLHCQAKTVDGDIVITLPDGSELPVDSERTAEALSQLLDRQVVVRRAGSDHTVRHEFPTELAVGEGDPFLWEPGLEGFFDRAPLHLITTSTINALSHANPNSAFHRARFRPNILVDTNEQGFIENDWVDSELRLGTVTCLVLDRKPRCVMTTRSQGGLAEDREIVRTIAKINEGNAGIELRAVVDGVLRIGDPVNLEVPST